MNGVVIKSTGSWYEVRVGDGSVIKCRLKGIFRLEESKDTNPVAVGDMVQIGNDDIEDSWVIEKIEDRQNYIVRTSPKHKGARQVIASNIDRAVLICTLAMPRTSMGFIDRFLITSEAYHIPTTIVFNKKDLLGGKELVKQQAVVDLYKGIGYDVYTISARDTGDIESLRSLLKDRTSLLAGHSGVGKSTLTNALQPGLELKTAEVSRLTGKGMHTTTFAEMYALEFGGNIIDTPGVREFGISGFAPEEIGQYFVEIREVMPQCRFTNCLHENEPDCAVQQAVVEGRISEQRFTSYLGIMADVRSSFKRWE
jgi:ribosome biogenesis GTPase